MKKILIYLDSDPLASAFDTVVAYDAGVDHVLAYAAITAECCAPIVEGAIYTRAPQHKHNTAIVIGGSDLRAGEALKQAILAQFFDRFRVSVMLDSGGCNTTAAAAVALLSKHHPLAGKTATVLAGTGPVGQRAAVMLALAGVGEVRLTSRQLPRAEQACALARQQYGVALTPFECTAAPSTATALADAQIVFAAGKTGVQLLAAEQWKNSESIEVMADVNTQPPLGIAGIQMSDRGTCYEDRCAVFGGLTIGALKLKLQRACIAALFTDNKQLLDAEEIYRRACRCLDSGANQ